jgi:hypothetical protein
VIDERAQPIPDGTRLLHIGPHKTGTTSVQAAFHSARAAVAAQGVHFAGPNRHPRQAAQAAAARETRGSLRGQIRSWAALLREIRRAPGRVVLSSEWFSDASDAAARLVIEDLDPTRTHVVVTLRPLASLLPSQWQQYVQAGTTTPYLEWLSAIFEQPASGAARRFWHRHRHDQLIERWASIVGPERVTAVVIDDRDHAAVLRAFERLAGLRSGTLALVPDRSNRSLTQPEAELIRALNAAMASVGLDGAPRLDLVLFGAAAALKERTPAAGEPRIFTPDWAIERAIAVEREIVAGIRATGARIDGDLDRLALAPTGVEQPVATKAATAWPEIAATGSLGVLTAGGLARSGSAGDPGSLSNQRLRSVLLGRLWDGARSLARPAPRMAGRSSSIHSARVEVE